MTESRSCFRRAYCRIPSSQRRRFDESDLVNETLLRAHKGRAQFHGTTEAELIAHCRLSIGGFKVPRAITVRDEPLPKSAAGKILKRDLRAPYWEGHDRAV